MPISRYAKCSTQWTSRFSIVQEDPPSARQFEIDEEVKNEENDERTEAEEDASDAVDEEVDVVGIAAEVADFELGRFVDDVYDGVVVVDEVVVVVVVDIAQVVREGQFDRELIVVTWSFIYKDS